LRFTQSLVTTPHSRCVAFCCNPCHSCVWVGTLTFKHNCTARCVFAARVGGGIRLLRETLLPRLQCAKRCVEEHDNKNGGHEDAATERGAITKRDHAREQQRADERARAQKTQETNHKNREVQVRQGGNVSPWQAYVRQHNVCPPESNTHRKQHSRHSRETSR
jgi:hypothetical protein